MKLSGINIEENQVKKSFAEGWGENRLKAYETFRALEVPTKRSEGWKYIDLSSVLNTDFDFKETAKTTIDLKDRKQFILESQCLAFVNGQLNEEFTSISRLPKAMILESIKETLKKPLDERYFNFFIQRKESNFFSLINEFEFSDGVYLYVPDGLQIEKPIQIVFLTAGKFEKPHAFFPRIVMMVGKRAKVDVNLQFIGLSDSHYLEDNVIDVLLQEDAKLNLNWIQTQGKKANRFSKLRAVLNQQSEFHLFTFTQGGAVTRNEIEVDAKATQARCFLNGLSCLSGESQAYHHASVHHRSTEGKSEQIYKTILAQKAKSEFDSLAHVEVGAQKSDTYQLNRNLLLSSDAQALTRPQLKIYADDVKCHHGATVGHLEDQEIFYLLSRGLNQEEARSLLIFGFAEEMLQKIKDETIRNFLNQKVHQELDQFVQNEVG